MRVENWEIKLQNYLMEAGLKPFKYGQMDCTIFIADWINILTGVDIIKEGRDCYKSLREGLVLIKQHRGSYENIMNQYFELHKTVKLAKRGDIVLKFFNNVPTFGIVGNSGKAFFKNEKGVLSFRVSECVKAWRVV